MCFPVALKLFLSFHHEFIIKSPGMKRLFQFKRHSSDYVILSMVALVLLVPNAALLSPLSSHDWHFSRTQGNGRNLLEMTESPPIDIHDSKFMIGYALGWVSAVVYFFALPPQIIKNVSANNMYSDRLPPNKRTLLGPAILSFVERLSSSLLRSFNLSRVSF